MGEQARAGVGQEAGELLAELVVPDAAGLALALGADLIAQYALDADSGLRALTPSTAAAPQGSGPRHLVVSDDATSAYLVTEFSGEVVRYARAEDGTLSARESVVIADPAAGLAHSRFGADPAAEHLIWGADLHVARGGSLLVATERTASTVASVELGADGVLGQVLAYAPLLLVGLWLGERLHRRFDERHFRISIYILLLVTGTLLLAPWRLA